jgi:hypothetical protein
MRISVPGAASQIHPVGSGFLVYAVLRSVYTVLSGGGVEWRGTKYPLGQLKDNVV